MATARDQSLGKVVSDLMRRGLAVHGERPAGNRGFPTFAVRDDNSPITLEDVKQDDDDVD